MSDDELAAVVDEAQSDAAQAALAQLPRDQQRLLGLVLEGYGHAEIAAVVGARSTKAIEGRVARAWEALRRVFIATERDEQCVPIRAALFSRRDSRDAQARVALHLDTCPNCRAFERRAKGLIAVSPLPAEPLWQPWLYRLAEVFPGRSPGSRAAETAASVGAGGGAAAAGLAGGGGLAVGIKVCGAAALTASVCSIALINAPEKPAKRPTRPEPKVRTVKPSEKKNAVALATVTATPTRTPKAKPTTTPRTRRRAQSARTRQSQEPPRSAATATQQAEAPVIQAAPAGAQEFEPGGNPDAPTPPTAAPAAGGSEFLP